MINSAVQPILNTTLDRENFTSSAEHKKEGGAGEKRVPPQVIINLEISNPTFISNNNYNIAIAKSPEEKMLEDIKKQNEMEVTSMFDQSFGLNNNPFDDMRFKFIARHSNKIDRMIQDILIS
jgi:hypothetical protein